MSQLLSWVCPCFFLGPSYAPIRSDEQQPYESSRPAAASVELTDGVDPDVERAEAVTDDERLPVYTIDEDAQLVEIAPLPPRRAPRTARPDSSVHSISAVAAPAAADGLSTAEGAWTTRPSLPPLVVDSGSASRVISVASSPSVKPSPSRWADVVSRQLPAPSRPSRLSRSVSATLTASDTVVPNGVEPADTNGADDRALSFNSLSAVAAAPRALFSFAAELSSKPISPSDAGLFPTQLLSTIASAVQQLTHPAALAHHSVKGAENGISPASLDQARSPNDELTVDQPNVEDEPDSEQPVKSSVRAHEVEDSAPSKGLAEQEGSADEKDESADHDEAGQMTKGVPSSIIPIPSPRRRQQSIVSGSPVLASSTQSTTSMLFTSSISPSVAPTSPGVSSTPSSPSSALLSSSFSSVASGVSLSSSVTSTSPRSSPFASSQLSSSHPTPLQLDPHISHTVVPSLAPAADKEEVSVDKSAETNGDRRMASHALTHDTFHRRLSSAAPPTTTATAAAPPSSIRTNPPSPAKGGTTHSSVLPSIPVALPTANATPAVHFRNGENPLMALGVPKGQLSVDHISAIIALFSPPSAVSSQLSSSPASLLSTLASHLTYVALFNFLMSAPRTISSAVFKHFSQPILARFKPPNPRPSPNAQIGLLLLQFLTDYMSSIGTSASALTFTFDFPRRAESFTLDVPFPELFIIESRHPSDPTLVHPLNVVRKADGEVRRIVFSRVVRVMLAKDRGIVGLGSGDLSVKKVFSFSCDMRYERRVGEVDVDSSGRQVVEDREGKVRVERGHYVLARYDDWLVVTVLGQQVQIGLPSFSRVND